LAFKKYSSEQKYACAEEYAGWNKEGLEGSPNPVLRGIKGRLKGGRAIITIDKVDANSLALILCFTTLYIQ
jgi:hypothetical protein